MQFSTNVGVPGRRPAGRHFASSGRSAPVQKTTQLLVQLRGGRFRQGRDRSGDVCFEVRSTNGTDVPADTESGLLSRFRNVQIAEYRKIIRTDIMLNGT